MKVHAYKSHVMVDSETVHIKGVCGNITALYAREGEDIPSSVHREQLAMLTHDPDKVTCASCRRTKIFPLLELDNTEL